jgi:hypothetical protein
MLATKGYRYSISTQNSLLFIVTTKKERSLFPEILLKRIKSDNIIITFKITLVVAHVYTLFIVGPTTLIPDLVCFSHAIFMSQWYNTILIHQRL